MKFGKAHPRIVVTSHRSTDENEVIEQMISEQNVPALAYLT
jgi:hypothetical protein